MRGCCYQHDLMSFVQKQSGEDRQRQQEQHQQQQVPRANEVMDSALACCTGGPGSIPAISKSKKVCKNSDGFSPSRHKVVGHKNGARHNNLHDLASPLSRKNILKLSTPSMGKHSVSARTGKKN